MYLKLIKINKLKKKKFNGVNVKVDWPYQTVHELGSLPSCKWQVPR